MRRELEKVERTCAVVLPPIRVQRIDPDVLLERTITEENCKVCRITRVRHRRDNSILKYCLTSGMPVRSFRLWCTWGESDSLSSVVVVVVVVVLVVVQDDGCLSSSLYVAVINKHLPSHPGTSFLF